MDLYICIYIYLNMHIYICIYIYIIIGCVVDIGLFRGFQPPLMAV